MQTFGMKKISTNLDGPNTSTSSMETMPIEITHASKYVNVLLWGKQLEIWVGSREFG
jgi:hypothetical protein